MSQWQPSASISTLRRRAEIIASIRRFFAERQVMEVDTPSMSAATVTDVHLHTFSTEFSGPVEANATTRFLQTSPEFAMKRLLAAGSGCIYQLAKAFRNEEFGRYHNPEFTLLEWYRVGYDHFQLMDEVDTLIQRVVDSQPAERMTYQDAFIRYLSIDPLSASLQQLQHLASQRGYERAEQDNDRDSLLNYLFCFHIEHRIGVDRPCFIYHFPASQAALAKLCDSDPRLAARFEVYFKGIELANGFYELTDADEQYRRFCADNEKRQAMGLAPQPIDYNLIDALAAGLPDCAGVALGVDRLLMLATNHNSIDEVIAFAFPRA